VDSLREQKKLEARKMLVRRDESHQSAARFVGWLLLRQTLCLKVEPLQTCQIIFRFFSLEVASYSGIDSNLELGL
jgi:hypothetical protein